jgi:uncharacterized membrane protein
LNFFQRGISLPLLKIIFMWQALAFISALFSALAAVFEKKALFRLEPLTFSFLLSAFTFVLTIPFLFFVDIESVALSAVLILYVKSILGAAAFLLVMHGIQKNELSNSLPLLALTPGVVALAAFFILGEEIGIRGIIGMLLLLSGTYFLQLEKDGNWRSPFLFLRRNKAQWYIIGAILLFSTTTILDKTLLKSFKLQPEAFLPLQQLFLSFNFLLLLLRKVERNSLGRSLRQCWKLILVVAIFAVVYRYSHILAIKVGPVALVLSIKRISIFFAALFGGHYFREQDVLRRSVAVLVMVTGAVLVILS